MGGPGAEITAEESASGIISVISNLTKEDSGNFYKWNGDMRGEFPKWAYSQAWKKQGNEILLNLNSEVIRRKNK